MPAPKEFPKPTGTPRDQVKPKAYGHWPNKNQQAAAANKK